jgi:hypothetical protein
MWSPRGPALAAVAGAITAAMAAPARWEVALFRTSQPTAAVQLLLDLAISIAWGAFCGLAGATVLRKRIATLLGD